MKHLLLILVLLSTSAAADYGFNDYGSVDDYDQDTGLLFALVSNNVEDAGILSSSKTSMNVNVNVFIYDPVSKTGRNLFQHNTNQITGVLIESGYDQKRKALIFLSKRVAVKENKNISSRKVRSDLLVETYDSKSKIYTVWVSPKNKSQPKALLTYKRPAAWHYSAKSQMIRLLTPKEGSIQVEEFVW